MQGNKHFTIATLGQRQIKRVKHVFHSVDFALALQGLKYRVLSRLDKVSKPRFVIYMVTDLCNLRCEMCGIWKQRTANDDLSLAEAEKVFADPWLADVEMIQFNGGEPTVRTDIKDLCIGVMARLPKLKHVSLTTNGYDTPRTLDLVNGLQKECIRRNISLDVQISIDGDQATHDKIRGRENAFQRTLETIKALKSNKIKLLLNATISQTNIESLEYLESFSCELNIPINYMPVQFRPRNFNTDIREGLELENVAAEKWSNYCAGESRQNNFRGFLYSILYSMGQGGARPIGCRYLFRGCVIAPNGDVRYCPHGPLMSNLRERSLKDIMEDPENIAIRKRLQKSVCSGCVPYGLDVYEAYCSFGKYLKHLY